MREIRIERNMSFEYVNMCRLCAGSSKDFIPIFENSGPTNFAEKIKAYLHIEIENSSDEFYMPRICHSCSEKIVRWDQYAEQVQKVQGLFSKFINTGNYLEFTESLLKEKEKHDSMKSSVIKKTPENQISILTTENFSEERKTAGRKEHKEFKKIKKKKLLLNEKCKNEFLNEDDNNDVNVPLSKIRKSITDPSSMRLNNVNKTETKIRLKLRPTKSEKDDDENKNPSFYKVDDREQISDSNKDHSCDEDEDDDDDDDNDTVKSENLQPLFTWECLKCHVPVKNWNALVKHCKEKHNVNASVQCVCGKFLQSRASIMKHRMTHTIGYGYRCEFENCNKTFHRQQLLNAHSISHMPKELQPWMCCKCSRRFHTESLLKQHEKIHLPKEEKLIHPCQVCQKKFCSKSAVSAHMRAVHFGERPFVCDQCGHSFTSKGILHEHLTIHSDVYNFHCKDCNKSFKTKYRLKIHMDTHVATRYQCPTCNLTLNTRRTLRMHLLVHRDVRAFKCSTCGKAFKRSKDLKNHCNLHTGRKPYTCPFCQRTFANGSNCRSHKRRMHPEELKLYEAAVAAGEKIDLADFRSNHDRAQLPITLKKKNSDFSDEANRPGTWASFPTEQENWENEFETSKITDSVIVPGSDSKEGKNHKILENSDGNKGSEGDYEEVNKEEEAIYVPKMAESENISNVTQIVFGNQSPSVQYPIENFYAFSSSAFVSNPMFRQ